MLLGYIRISKSDGSQSFDLQRDALLAVGVAPERIYEDCASGRHDARPGLEACLKALRPEDTLVVWKLDRLGRNLRHLVTLVETLHQREVEMNHPAASCEVSKPRLRTAMARQFGGWMRVALVYVWQASLRPPPPGRLGDAVASSLWHRLAAAHTGA